MLPRTVDVDVVRGLRSATLPHQRDDCLFRASSHGVCVAYGLQRESLVLAILFVEPRALHQVNGLSIRRRVRRSIQPIRVPRDRASVRSAGK